MSLLVSQLRVLPLFSDFSEDHLCKVTRISEERSLSTGQVIFKAGEAGKDIFVVQQGEIEVLLTDCEDSLACTEWLAFGDVLGIRAFFPPYKYLYTARCLTDGRVCAVNIDKLRELIEYDAYLAIAVYEGLMQAMLKRVTGLRSIA